MSAMMKSRSRRRRECRKWSLGKERREGVHAVHGGIFSGIVCGVTGGIVGGIVGGVTGDIVGGVTGDIACGIVGGVTGGIVGSIAGDVERREEAEGESREEDSREQLIVGDGVEIAADVDGKMEGVSGR